MLCVFPCFKEEMAILQHKQARRHSVTCSSYLTAKQKDRRGRVSVSFQSGFEAYSTSRIPVDLCYFWLNIVLPLNYTGLELVNTEIVFVACRILGLKGNWNDSFRCRGLYLICLTIVYFVCLNEQNRSWYNFALYT